MIDLFGIGRSIEPAQALPQQAWRVDNTMELRPDELLVNVEVVSVNLVSFNEIREAAGDNDRLLCHRVLEIIRDRGKLHNPVTNTGGSFYGTVAQMGADYPNHYGLSVGDKMVSLTSLTITPLRLERILAVDYDCAQLTVEGQAILFATSPVVRQPDDIPLRVALAAMDEAGVATCTNHVVQRGQSVLILGAGGRSGLLSAYGARDKLGETGRLVGVVRNAAHRDTVEHYGLYDEVLDLNATDAQRLCMADDPIFTSRFDVVVNCINSVSTEVAALVAVKPQGTIYFATLGCDYKFAGLTAEGIGKQVDIIPYTGFMDGHAQYTLNLLRRYPQMQNAIQQEFVGAQWHRLNYQRETELEGCSDAGTANAGGYIFRSSQSKATLRQAWKVARYTSNVMICGESGVGKEIIARIIHQNSNRKSFPMIKINCAAIPENLLESELFGYEKGSFTGASTKGKVGLGRPPRAAPSFWMRWGSCPCLSRPSSCGLSRRKKSSGWGVLPPLKWMCALWLPPTGIWRTW